MPPPTRLRAATILIMLVIVLPIAAFKIGSVRASGGVSSVQQSALSSVRGRDGLNSTNFQMPYTSPRGILGVESEVAAGPNHVMQVLQSGGQIFYKGRPSSSAYPFPMSKIFTLMCNPGGGDTRVLFDPSAGSNGRWFATTISADCAGNMYADIAVSPTNDPSTPLIAIPTPWKDYHATTNWDHPEIAVTSDKLVFTSFLSRTLLAYNKGDLVNAIAAPGYQDLTSQIPSSCAGQPYPVRNSGSISRQYMICMGTQSTTDGTYPFYLFYIDGTPQSGVPNASCSTISSTCAGVPQITPLQITSLNPPFCCKASNNSPQNIPITPYAVAPSGSGTLTGYVTFAATPLPQAAISAFWFNNWLWFATTARYTFSDNSQQDSIRLVRLSASASGNTAPSINQTIDLKQQGTDVFLPAISIDGMGDMALIFAYSSSSIYPSLAVVGQGFSDPLGSLTPWKTLKAGFGYDGLLSMQGDPFNDWKNRYSDFFGAAVDPSDPTLIWVSGAYFPQLTCGSDSKGPLPCWESWVSSVRVVGLRLSSSSFLENLGLSASIGVTVQALNGFSGTVSLSITESSGSSASLSLTNLTLGVGGSGSTIVTVTTSSSNCSVPNCSFFLEIGATAPLPDGTSLSFQLFIPFTVLYFDFTVGVSPSSLTISALYSYDSSVSTTLTVTLFANATVSNSTLFSASGQPSYMQVSFSPSSLYPATSGTAVTVTFTIPGGNKIISIVTYTVAISGSGFSRTHSATVSITVYPDCTPKFCPTSPSP